MAAVPWVAGNGSQKRSVHSASIPYIIGESQGNVNERMPPNPVRQTPESNLEFGLCAENLLILCKQRVNIVFQKFGDLLGRAADKERGMHNLGKLFHGQTKGCIGGDPFDEIVFPALLLDHLAAASECRRRRSCSS